MMVMGTLAIFTSSISARKVLTAESLPSAATSIGGASSSSSISYLFRETSGGVQPLLQGNFRDSNVLYVE